MSWRLAQKQYGDEASLVALFTFVARDPLSHKAVAVNPLRPSSEPDRALFAERQRIADERRAARRAASQGTGSPSAHHGILYIMQLLMRAQHTEQVLLQWA